ncbi:conserved hypothetical protein, partial [Ricinus communis]
MPMPDAPVQTGRGGRLKHVNLQLLRIRDAARAADEGIRRKREERAGWLSTRRTAATA